MSLVFLPVILLLNSLAITVDVFHSVSFLVLFTGDPIGEWMLVNKSP